MLSCLLSIFIVCLEVEASIEDVLLKIAQRGYESQSDSVIIIQRGRGVIASYGSVDQCEPIDTYSITKSFVGLAVGLLLQEGRIDSIDIPVYAFYPEWRQGVRQKVTLRHLLSLTSGFDISDECDIYRFPDAVRMALASEFASFPGTSFRYSNKAVNLLAGVIKKATGVNVHEYLKSRLFDPMGITSDTWLCDASGNNYGMSHLSLTGVDLAKIGTLISDNGCWNGRRLLSEAWIEQMLAPSQNIHPFYSLLWWIDYRSLSIYWDKSLLDCYAAANIPQKYIDCLANLNGFVFHLVGPITYKNYKDHFKYQLAPYFCSQTDIDDFLGCVESIGLPIARWQDGWLRTLSARGSLGQQLIIRFENQLVAVRLSSRIGDRAAQDTFADLGDLLDELSRELALYPYGYTGNCVRTHPCNYQPDPAATYPQSHTVGAYRDLYNFRSLFRDDRCSQRYRFVDPCQVEFVDYFDYRSAAPANQAKEKPVENSLVIPAVTLPEEVQIKPAESFDFKGSFEGVVNTSSENMDSLPETVQTKPTKQEIQSPALPAASVTPPVPEAPEPAAPVDGGSNQAPNSAPLQRNYPSSHNGNESSNGNRNVLTHTKVIQQ